MRPASCSGSSPAHRRAWPGWCAGCAGRRRRWRSSGPAARSSTRCWGRLTVVVISPNQLKNLRAATGPRQQGRPVRLVRAGRHAAHRPGPAAAAAAGQPGHRHLAPACRPARPGRHRVACATSCAPTSSSPSPARSGCSRPRSPSAWPSWPASTAGPRDWLSPRRLPPAGTRLLRPQRPRRAARPLAAAPAAHRRRRRRPGAHHPRAARRPASLVQQIKALTLSRRAARPARRRAHLHLAAPLRTVGRPAARRDGDCRPGSPPPKRYLPGRSPPPPAVRKTTSSTSAAADKQLRTPPRLAGDSRPPAPGQPLYTTPRPAKTTPRHPHPRPRLLTHLHCCRTHRLRPPRTKPSSLLPRKPPAYTYS